MRFLPKFVFVLSIVALSACSPNDSTDQGNPAKLVIQQNLNFNPPVQSGTAADVSEFSNLLQKMNNSRSINGFPKTYVPGRSDGYGLFPRKYANGFQAGGAGSKEMYWLKTIQERCSIQNPKNINTSIAYRLNDLYFSKDFYDSYHERNFKGEKTVTLLSPLKVNDSVTFTNKEIVKENPGFGCPVTFDDTKTLNAKLLDVNFDYSSHKTNYEGNNDINLDINSSSLQYDTGVKSVTIRSKANGLVIKQNAESLTFKYEVSALFNLLNGSYPFTGTIEFLSHLDKIEKDVDHPTLSYNELIFSGSLTDSLKAYKIDMYMKYPNNKLNGVIDGESITDSLIFTADKTAQIYLNGYPISDRNLRKDIIYWIIRNSINQDIFGILNF